MNASSPQHLGGLDPYRGAVPLEPGQKADLILAPLHSRNGCSINAASSRAFMQLSDTALLLQLSAAMDTPGKIRVWMLGVMERTGWSARQWASEAGVAATTIQRAIKPDYPFVTSSRTLEKLARAANEPAPDVTEPSGPIVKPTFLPIRYEVGAGMWRAIEDLSQPYGTAPVAADPAFAGFAQWLERVVSDSMDREYPVGSLLHVVDAAAVGYVARQGDHVIVERRRNGGGLVERTVKEAVYGPKGLELWGRSNDPRWNKPIAIVDGIDDESLEAEIVGLVIGSYRPRLT